jgi:hypothetical protein
MYLRDSRRRTLTVVIGAENELPLTFCDWRRTMALAPESNEQTRAPGGSLAKGGLQMFASISRRALAALVLGSVAACGGGGGYGGGSPAPAPTYTIGGSVSGLAGTGLVLQNNGGANLTITGNGAFTFATALASGGFYNVTAVAQPTNLSQTCTIANASGAVAGANVTNIAVSCATNSFTVGGTISGLAGSGLVLIDNGGDEQAIAANGAFAFVTRVASGGTYDVRVLTQPSDPVQLCRITSNSGSVANTAITAPTVTCVTQHPRFAYSLDALAVSIDVQ